MLTGVTDVGSFPVLPQPLRVVPGWHARALDRQLQHLAGQRPGGLPVRPQLSGESLFAADAIDRSTRSYARWAAHLADAIT